jgi:hypothetical protein
MIHAANASQNPSMETVASIEHRSYKLLRTSVAVWLSALIALVFAMLWVVMVAESDDANASPLRVLFGFVPATLIMLVICGKRWARWLLILSYMGPGLVLLFTGASESILGVGLGSAEFGWSVGLGLLLVSAGVALFVSEKLDEFLARATRIRGREPNWREVATSKRDEPESLRSSIEPPPFGERGFVRFGRLAPLAMRITAIAGWVFLLTVGYVVGFALLRTSQGLEGADQLGNAVEQATASIPPLASAAMRFAIAVSTTFLIFFAVVLLPAAFILVLFGGYVVQFLVPFLLVLPFTLPVVTRWRTPARCLVLRPFSRERLSTASRKLLRRDVATLGHCYILTKADARIPLHVRIARILGKLSMFTFRPRRIVHPTQVDKLARAMGHRIRRNLNWCFSWDKLFAVACVSSGWQACVSRLTAEVDAVVVDLSGVSELRPWELELLKRTAGLERTVFVAEESSAEQAQSALGETLGPESPPVPLILYRGTGKHESRALHAAVLDILRPQSEASPANLRLLAP